MKILTPLEYQYKYKTFKFRISVNINFQVIVYMFMVLHVHIFSHLDPISLQKRVPMMKVGTYPYVPVLSRQKNVYKAFGALG